VPANVLPRRHPGESPGPNDAARPPRVRVDRWRLSVIAVVVGAGLLAVALADVLARGGSTWAHPRVIPVGPDALLWTGMALLWVPPTLRLIGVGAGRRERMALLVLLGMALYVVKVLYSPRYFVQYDEFAHWRTANDIAVSRRLFVGSNPLLPVSPLYPGMELVTTALAKLTGLSLFACGTLIIAAARLSMIVALYLLYERLIGSSRLAGVATAVYFTNPQFLFFDSAYAYESLALSLAVVVLYTVLRVGDERGRSTAHAALVILLPLAAAVVTHHVTSFALAIVLLLLAATSVAFSDRVALRLSADRAPRGSRLWYWSVAVVATAFVVVWLFLVAGRVIGYLEPNITSGVNQVITLILGETAPRHLFGSYVGRPTPSLDRAAALSFTAIVLLALPLGWLQIWRVGRLSPAAVLFVLCSLAYPAAGLFRFTPVGAELNERLAAFVFVPVSYCVAMALARRRQIKFSRVSTTALTAIGALLLYGGIAIGTPYWGRLPGPYLVSADQRSIEPEGMAAASWAKEFLGPDNRVATDRINQVLMMTYGGQWLVTSVTGKLDPTPVFFSPQLTPGETRLLRRSAVRYVIVDYRLTRSLPWLGFYYEPWEAGALDHKKPIPVAAFAKFDRSSRISRVFDSGNIVIFDVQGVARHG
jgi:hypothetical protein